MYALNKDNLQQLKDIGFDNLIRDFGEVIGSNLGGDDDALKEARMFMRDFINEISRQLDPENHQEVHEEFE